MRSNRLAARLKLTFMVAVLTCFAAAASVRPQVKKSPNRQPPVVATTAAPGSGAIVNCQTFTATDIDETLGTCVMTELSAPVFSYQKMSDTSTLKVTYQDTVGNSGMNASTCQYQIRVDGNQSDPASLWPTPPLLVVSNMRNISLSSTGFFKNLPAGAHRVSIFQSQVSATQCIRNSGGFMTTIIVEEMELP